MRKLLISILLVGISCLNLVIAQSISNIRAVQSGDDIQIFYDLIDPNSGTFLVTVFCSVDGGVNWGSALQHVEGDANNIISAGTNRKIIWHVLNEKSELIGDQIQFEIRAKQQNVATPASFAGNVLMDSRDGQSYQVIKILNTYWMAENLNYNSPASFCYNNDANNCKKYGRLYTWDDATKNCPTGWRLPDEKEWGELETYLGLAANLVNVLRWRGTDQGEKLKKGGPSGFDALYGGFRSDRGVFDRIGTYSYFWSGEFDTRISYCRLILYNNPGVYLNRYNKNQAMSVRCVRN